MPQVNAPRTLVDYVATIATPVAGARDGDHGTTYTYGLGGDGMAVANGFTVENVTEAWRILREAGCDLPGRLQKRSARKARKASESFDPATGRTIRRSARKASTGERLRDPVSEASFRKVESILHECLAARDERIPWYSVTYFATDLFADRKARARVKRARRVERLRDTGYCIMCGYNPAPQDTSTCADCGRKANARKKARKAKVNP